MTTLNYFGSMALLIFKGILSATLVASGVILPFLVMGSGGPENFLINLLFRVVVFVFAMVLIFAPIAIWKPGFFKK